MKRLGLILAFLCAFLCAAFPALAQTAILQGGPWAPGHIPMYVGQGTGQVVVQDSGPAGGGGTGLGLSELLVTARGSGTPPYAGQGTGPLGTIVDYYDAPTTNSSGYHWLGFSPNINGNAVIATGYGGGASAQGLCFNINGTQLCLPSTVGSGFVTYTPPVTSTHAACWSSNAGVLDDCGVAIGAGTPYTLAYYSSASQISGVPAGTSGQILLGQTGAAPAFESIGGDATSLSATGVLAIGKVNGVAYPSSPSVGTAPYVSSANTVTYGAVPVSGGGTGDTALAAGGVLIGNGAGAITSVTSSSIGLCLQSQGAGQAPIYNSCAAGTGSAAGQNTQVQFNNGGSLAGSANFTWVSPLLTIGQNAVATGQLGFANGGGSGATVTIQNNTATSAYNFNLPATAGASGQPLISGGGGSTAMSFATLGIGGGGTNCSAASGTCLDNITGFSSTGFINRTGAGTYAFAPQISLANGGTSANLTASNGGLVYSTSGAMAILSGTATANQIPLSGANTAPAWSTATYPATTTINQMLYSSASNTIAGLATANSGVLITSSGGVPSISSTLPAAVQGNITALGTIAAGIWQGSPIALAYGGTNAALSANNGGIFYSTASAGAILAGTATANQPLLSGATTAPAWATISYVTSATSGGVPYFSSSSAMASSAALTQFGVVFGGGTGGSPTGSAAGTAGQILVGQTSANAAFETASGDVSGISNAGSFTFTATNTHLTTLANLTTVGTIGTGAWQGTPVALAYGGSNANLTASNGGIIYSTASAMAVLAGTSTAGQCLLSGNLAAPNWGSCAGGAAVSSVGNASADTTLTLAGTGSGPYTGAVTAKLNLGNANTWTAAQTFSGTANFTGTFQINSNTITWPGSATTVAALNIADQTITGGANVTSQSQSTGNITVDCGSRPLQYITGNTSAWTITAPSNDGSCILLITNAGASAVIPTFSGFTVGSNTGDTLTTTASSKFMLWIGRVNGTSSYTVKALQ